MILLDLRGGYLYQHCVDLFPEGHLTPVEHELWAMYYQDKHKNR